MLFTNPPKFFPIAKRIISVVPSLTEFLHSIHLFEETIAITRFCIHPADWFNHKPRIGGTKQLHINDIISLKPDLIIASKEENVKEQIEELAENIPVYLTDINSLEDALESMRNIGRLTDRDKRAEMICTEIENKFAGMQNFQITSAAYLIWKDPYMAAGNGTFINNMMQHAGFSNCFADTNRYPSIDISRLMAANPQWILLSSEPYPFREKHVQELQHLMPDKKIMCVDGEMFSWYGSRLLYAPDYFAQIRKRMQKIDDVPQGG